MGELLAGDLINIINSAISPLSKRIDKVENNLKEMNSEMHTIDGEIESLKSTITEQQDY